MEGGGWPVMEEELEYDSIAILGPGLGILCPIFPLFYPLGILGSLYTRDSFNRIATLILSMPYKVQQKKGYVKMSTNETTLSPRDNKLYKNSNHTQKTDQPAVGDSIITNITTLSDKDKRQNAFFTHECPLLKSIYSMPFADLGETYLYIYQISRNHSSSLDGRPTPVSRVDAQAFTRSTQSRTRPRGLTVTFHAL
jgi:hypothetical protein